MRFWLVLTALLAGLLLWAAPAGAHAVLVGSDPADGSRLTAAPAKVTLRFDEPVGLDLGYLRVVDGSGNRVDAGAAQHPNGDGTAVSVSLKAGLGDSSYLASYRVTSADSHPIAGSIRFVRRKSSVIVNDSRVSARVLRLKTTASSRRPSS